MTGGPTEPTGDDASTDGRDDRSSESSETGPTSRRPAGAASNPGSSAGSISRRTVLAGLAASAATVAGAPGLAGAQSGGNDRARQLEALDRGLVAIAVDEGVFVRWRLFGTDPDGIAFNLYRDGTRVNDSPITGATNYTDPDGSTDSTYSVRPVVDGTEQEESKSVDVWQDNYKDIPLNRPGDQYHPNDCSVGDLTGDGRYDLVVKWYPDNAQDNAFDGVTDPTIFDAYTLDGEHLWRIDLGRNVRSGAHYAQFLVYDFDGDGISEFVVRTADGTTDGTGNVIGDPDADHVDGNGRILEGPEYLTVFDGSTGEEIVSTDFEPARGDICSWGDCYGNRGERFLAGVAYLDGERPSIVQCRGYYERTALAAFDFRDGELTQRWHFDSADGWGEYAGQGNHQLSIADVDGDGYDEIVYGACVIDHDGTGLHSTGWTHGDALHCGDLVPSRDGLEIFMPHESGPYGATMRDAETGDPLWTVEAEGDVGRGVAGNIDPSSPGAEAWASNGVGLREGGSGDRIADAPGPKNSLVWWTGDLKREFLDDTWIGEWDPAAQTDRTVADFSGVGSNNGTKANACLSADILGDWREEVLLRRSDNEAIRLFVTPYETDHRLYTLMHDSQYRTAIAWQNVGYNQPPHPSFYVGADMDDPPTPNVELVGADDPFIGTGPDVPTVPADEYQLVNENSGHVLEVAAGDDSDGASVRQGSDDDLASQRWTLRYVGEGAYEIVNSASGKVLDVLEASEENGADVTQWIATGGENQQWYVERNDDGTVRLTARHSGLVLGVQDASTADEANVVQWEWTENDDQRWRLEPVAPRTAGTGPYTVEGAGADIWGTSDAFHYYSAATTGDFDVSVNVADVEDTDEYAKAGLMVRESTDAGAKNAMIRRTPSATTLQWRPEAGAESVSLTSGATGESEVSGGTTDHAWQRLVRAGDVLRAYTSADGEDWQLLAEISMSLSETVRLGLAVTSHASGTLCTGSFDDLIGFTPSESQDVGSVDVAGSASSDGDTGDLPPVGSNANPPTDLDGDGLYEDVNGDGTASQRDVAAFFEHLDGDAVQNNPDAFNFDGEEGIGFSDIVALFQRV